MKTLYGHLVFEVVGDPSNNYGIVIPDTEMPPWMCFAIETSTVSLPFCA
jgi:hypothetical protein